MATINGSTNTSVWTFKLEVTEGSQNIANNTSPVTVSAYIGRPASAGASYMYGASISCPVSVTGCTSQTISYSNANQVNVAAGAWLLLGSKTFTVPHDSDGKKTVTISASFTNNVSPASGSASGSMVLSTIPRATTPTIPTSATMGSAITITVTPADSSFKHKLRYSFGTLNNCVTGLSEGNDFTPSGTRSITFTPPTSLGSEIPSAVSGTCTVYCYTYTSSGTHIGTTSKTITLSVPSYSPTASVAITGNNLLSSEYVQGKSTVSATITASSSYGATIKSYSSVIDTKTYTGATFTTSALSAGSKTIETTVTDTRGKSVKVSSQSIDVREYFLPQVTSFTLERQSDGTTVIAKFGGKIASINSKNDKSFTVTLNGVTMPYTATYTFTNGSLTFKNVPTDNTLIATAKISDHYTYDTMDAVLPTVAVTMDFHYSGTGIAMGKVAEKEKTLDMAWPIRSSGWFNQNSWGNSKKGALTQVIDESSSQHAAIVGVNANEERVYSIEFFDDTTNPHMKLYAGSDALTIGKNGLLYNGYNITYLIPIWSGTLTAVNATATMSQAISNFKYLEIFFHDNDGYYDSKCIRNANGTAISVNVGHTAIGASGYLKQMPVRFTTTNNVTTLTVISNKQIAISTTTGTGAANNGVITDGQFITIDAIVGIK